jgi:hypothetical protein
VERYDATVKRVTGGASALSSDSIQLRHRAAARARADRRNALSAFTAVPPIRRSRKRFRAWLSTNGI